MDIQFDKFNSEQNLLAQRKLFVECFPETNGTPVISEEHYLWKFKSFPCKDKERAYEYVAIIDDELIGYYAAIPYEYKLDGKIVSAAMVCDVMTGIKARGKGVFTKLGNYSTEEFRKEGLAFSTGYPIRPEVIPGHKKVGWSFPFQIPMYGKFLRLNAFLHNRRKAFLIPFANLAIYVYNTVFKIIPQSGNHMCVERYDASQIAQIPGFPEFIQAWQADTPISLNKSIDFFSWRLGAPDKQYEIIVLRDIRNQRICGYSIVSKISKESVPCLGVMDFILLNDSKGYSGSLLREIENTAIKNDCELILMMMLHHKAMHYKIKWSGFLKTPFPFSFIIKQFDESIDSNLLFEENSWDLMWIDSDDL